MAARAAGPQDRAGGPQDHVVQFYDDVAELADAVGPYLAEGLRQGDVAIVVATARHHEAFATFLRGEGIDVTAARADGRLVELDAAETLARFMAGATPDAAAFDDAIGGLVRSGLERGRVRAFGEMVAILWDQGLVTAAMELEALWNDLGRQLDFSLFCAYPAGGMADAERTAFAEVCHLHSEVLGSGPARCWPEAGPAGPQPTVPEVSREFDCSVGSIRAARTFVTDALHAAKHGAVADPAAVIVTELATNAVLHAGTAFHVTLRRGAEAVEIRVWDASPDVPVRGNPPLDALSGRGMRLVEGLAQRWGVELPGHGKTVWAQLRSPGASPGLGTG